MVKKSRLYRIYHHMKQRCYNPNNDAYHHYGGRGVSVCRVWLNNFKLFELWSMLNGYALNLSIDRIDVDGDYCPTNCRWVTQAEQMRNTRRNVFLTVGDETKTLTDWADEYGVDKTTLRLRLKRGMPLVDALTQSPFDVSRESVISLTTGEAWDSCRECAEALGVSRSAVSAHFSGRLKHIRGHKLKKVC